MSVWCHTLAPATPEKNSVHWHGVPVGIDWLQQSFHREVGAGGIAHAMLNVLTLPGLGNDRMVRVRHHGLTTIGHSFLLVQARMSELAA
jgi:hypothetical protein